MKRKEKKKSSQGLISYIVDFLILKKSEVIIMDLPEDFISTLNDSKEFYTPNYKQNITQIIPTMINLLDLPVTQKILPRNLVHLDPDYDIVVNLMIDSLGFKQWQKLHNMIQPDFSEIYSSYRAFPCLLSFLQSLRPQ